MTTLLIPLYFAYSMSWTVLDEYINKYVSVLENVQFNPLYKVKRIIIHIMKDLFYNT